MPPYHSRKNKPGAHDVWGKGHEAGGSTQWKRAVTREFAQYHRIEKVAKEFDNSHEVNYSMVHRKERSVHLDDQELNEVKKKVP